MLPHSSIGSGDPAIVFVHGFTQTRSSWRQCAEMLANRHRCILVDAPHHGEAQSCDLGHAEAARAVGDSARDSVLVGYSMGGRLALEAALHGNVGLRALVLVSTTAGIESDVDRERRRGDDETLASRVESIGTAAFLAEWLAQPLFAHSRRDPEDFAGRASNAAESLARSLRRCGAAEQPSSWNELHRLAIPTLVVAGAEDAKFVGLAHRLNEGITGSELVIIDHAGHSVHLDQPERFAEVLGDFLDRRVKN